MNGTLTKESSFVRNRAKLFSPTKTEEDAVDCNSERKKPSYVNLSCAVSGYSGLNRYDSKARQEIRSRESSRDRLPLCLTRSRDSSPSPTKPFPDNLSSAASRRSIGLILSLEHPPNVSGVSPVTLSTHHSATTGQRSKSVDRGFLRQNFLNGYLNSSGKPPSGVSSSMGVTSTFINTSATSTAVTSLSCHKSTENVTVKPSASSSDDPTATRGRLRIRNSTVASSSAVHERISQQQQDSSSNKSFIQQRIERLYGPAALARGFFTVKTSPHKGHSSKVALLSKSLNNNNNEQSADEVEATTNRTRARTTDGTCSEAQQPPVFRHLNAEFRQQLQLKKSRSRSIENRLDETVSPSKILSPTDSHPSSSHQSGMTVVAVNSAAAGGSDENGCCPNGDVVVINSPRSAIAANDTDQQNLAGHRFLRILDDERQRLNRLILEAEVYLADAAVVSSEELTGKIRAAIGKCKLLLAQKFEQFAGLCRKNLTQNSDEPFPTTSEDLAGFWDMVNIQVDHINTLFGELQTLQSNGWVEVVAASTLSSSSSNNKAVKKSNRSTSNAKASVASTPRSAKAEEAAKAREEARRKMMEDRKRMMKAKKAEDWVITEKPETNGDVEAMQPQKNVDGEVIV